MTTRSRSHVQEDEARNRLRDAFHSRGWTIEDLRNDYGEDMLVRIFDDGRATPWMFFVQSKATDNIDRHRRASKATLGVPVRVSSLLHWQSLWEPVVLTLWSPQADATYWEIVQDERASRGVPRAGQKTTTVSIWTANRLDDDGLDQIRARTIERFQRYEAEQRGARALLDLLEETLGAKVTEYDPAGGFLAIELPDGSADWHMFGELAELLMKAAEKSGMTPQETLLATIEAHLSDERTS
jgi:Domain of unknown function (DUF4365)